MKIALGSLVLVLATTAAAQADDSEKQTKRQAAVFTTTNEVEGNRVLAFEVRPDGELGEGVPYNTGGVGSGDSLGSQSALVLSEDHRFLIAVNAGSDDISLFEVEGAELSLRQHIASGGKRPISVTERAGLVYVVNAVGNNVAGFALDPSGKLDPMDGSIHALSGGAAGPGQIELSPDASSLVVTEKTRNVITQFHVDGSGKLSEITTTVSVGTTPFGFEFTRRGDLIVSEAATGSMSSYAVGDKDVAAISSAVSDTQMAPCWVAISADDRFAFTANAGSASISSYAVSGDGEIALKDAKAADLGKDGAPLDLAFARGSFLYALDRGNTSIVGYALGDDGALSPLPASSCELPAFTSGLSAY